MALMARYPDKHFDLAIVDPPYRDDNQPTKEMRQNGSMKTIKGKPITEFWNELKRVSKEQIVWGANNFGNPFMGFVVWDKKITGVKGKYSDCEIASLSEGLSTVSSVYSFSAQNQLDKIHPTQKPVALYKWLLKNYATPDMKILDTHLGSGSIAIACHEFGCDLTACELDSDYYEASIKRIQNHVNQTNLFL